MNCGRALSWTAARFPERVGIVGRRRLTYREWDARTNQIAHALAGLGVRRGDRVALVLSNSETLASTHLALQKLGVLSTPLNVRFSPVELGHCLADSEPTVLLSEDATAALTLRALADTDVRPTLVHDGDNLPEGATPFEDLVATASDSPVQVAVGDDDPSVMLYTSGTTGRPKGVPRTQRNEVAATLAHVVQAQYTSGDSTLGAMPMYHTMGLRSLLAMIIVGGRFVTLPRFDAGAAIELLEAEAISSLYLVPTAFWALSEACDLSRFATSLRKLAFAGAPMTSTLTAALNDALEPQVFINHYGSSEIYTFSICERAAAKPGCAGRPGIFALLRVVAVDSASPDDTVEPGETGEIIASLDSDEAFRGYWRRPDSDAKALHGGWYFTGDLGHVDEDGDLWVAGRVDDMIITGGENVHPVEVEDVLARCPDVEESAVVGLPDQHWGQAVTAFVVAVPGRDASDTATRVAGWLGEQEDLASYKRPKRIVVVDEIPKNPVGKLLRRKLVSGEYTARAEQTTSRGVPARG